MLAHSQDLQLVTTTQLQTLMTVLVSTLHVTVVWMTVRDLWFLLFSQDLQLVIMIQRLLFQQLVIILALDVLIQLLVTTIQLLQLMMVHVVLTIVSL